MAPQASARLWGEPVCEGIGVLTIPATPRIEALLQRDIDSIRAKLTAMAALDVQALTRAFQSLLKRDRQLAYSVILREQDIDAAETELDRLCLEFIVRHQPAAGHLRFVYSASKVATEMERVGDYAESIARQVLWISHVPFKLPIEKFSEIANLAIPMFQNAVRAFVEKNADLARTTMACEPRVNQVRDNLNAELHELRQQDRLPLEVLAPLLTITRRFERVSDQATNICEHALYFATGENLRHTSLPQGFRVLFVDETNGCLSRMAEAIGERTGAKRFSFSSAGLAPDAVDPQTICFLADRGIDISHKSSKPVGEVTQQGQFQVIVVLCKEAESALPQKPTKSLGLHWFVADPSKARGTPQEIRAAYERAFDSLSHQIGEMVQAIIGDDQERNHDKPA
jgi:phosphate transport system protein